MTTARRALMRMLETLVALAVVLGAGACAPERTAVAPPEAEIEAATVEVEPRGAPPVASRSGFEALPLDVRLPLERALSAGDSRFAPHEAAGGVVLEAAGSRAEVSVSGARVELAEQSLTLRAESLGRAGDMHALARDAEPTIEGVEVHTARATGVSEWWRALPSGLEHGVTIDEPPAGEGALVLELAVGGDLAARERSDDAVDLVDTRGERAGSYTHLAVLDADGARIPARMAVERGRIVVTADDAGARYPLVVDPLVAVEEATLAAPDGLAGDFVGQAIALSGDGTYAVVGAHGDSTPTVSQAGSARVFRYNGTAWVHEATLTSPTAMLGDELGRSVDISSDGTRVIVGVDRGDFAGVNSGGALVFFRSGTTWTLEGTLLAPDLAAGDLAGGGVAMTGDGSVAIVGARGNDFGAFSNRGTAEIFVRTGTSWAHQASLRPTGGASDDQAGVSVDIAGDATSGVRAIVSDPRRDGTAGAEGSAHVFRRSGTTWTLESSLQAADGVAGEQFGNVVAFSADASRALVSMFVDPPAGSVRVFARTGMTWTEEATLRGTGSAAGDSFGGAITLSSDARRAVIGSSGEDAPGADAGAIRLYRREGSGWTEDARVTHSGTAAGDFFGHAVALAGDASRFGVGAFSDDVGAIANVGTARIFTLRSTNGTPCVGSGSECTSGFCIDGVCCNTACGGSSATDCQACSAALTGGPAGTCAALSSGAAATVTCRPSAGPCDVGERCSPSSTACPTDVFSTTTCRVAAGACDVAEVCTGSSATCPADLLLTGPVCRPSADVCDVAETCTGSGVACPPDAVSPSGTECRPAGPGSCDIPDRCDGASVACPRDLVATSGTVCRAQAGACDSIEVCDGMSPICPGDAFEPMGNVCGTETTDCALPAVCTGLSPMCPSVGVRAAGTPCGVLNGECDRADSCDGTSQLCPDTFQPATTPCGTTTAERCDAPDHCTGTSADCEAVFLVGVECRPSAGACDPAELCLGDSPLCQPDQLAPAATVCRASVGVCDPAESCDGVAASCPADETTCTDVGRIDAGGGAADVSAGVDGGAPAPVEGCRCLVAPRTRVPWMWLALAGIVLGASARRRA